MALSIEIATVRSGGGGPWLPSGQDVNRIVYNQENIWTPCQAYQQALIATKEDILVMLHDDLEILERDWLDRIRGILNGHPRCVAAGFGGALSLGSPDLYRKPYRLERMARGGYGSNQTDWAAHGTHETGERQVVVLDAFAMAVRTDWLRDRGGWPTGHLTHHCLDLWLACETARARREIWTAGVSCTHHGGGTSTKREYAEAKWLQGGSLASDHQAPHRWLFENYRDCLPLSLETP